MDLDNYIERLEKAMNTFSKMCFSKEMRGLEITLTQMQMLLLINSLSGCKMSDLSEALGVTMGNVTSMIDRLIKEDLVKRCEDDNDRRIVRIELTKNGKDTVKTILGNRKTGLSRIFKNVNESDKAALLNIMERIAAVL
jgi:DNA-binding MarR family transcriptional regulator